MVAEGLPPSSREVRDLLLPVIDDLPDRDDLPEGFRLVLREIDRFLASRPTSTEAPVAHEPTAEVLEARRLLGGRSIVLIGGMCRPEAREALREALGLGELDLGRDEGAPGGRDRSSRPSPGPRWPWCCWRSAGRAMPSGR